MSIVRRTSPFGEMLPLRPTTESLAAVTAASDDSIDAWQPVSAGAGR